MSVIRRLTEKGLANPPKWLSSNIMFEVRMGSTAYGCNDENSDCDIYAFCMPKKEMVFPHLAGQVQGFGTPKEVFEQYHQPHLIDPDAKAGKGEEYDLTCYSIVKYFNLCWGCNPNMLDSLFVSRECISHSTKIGEMVRSKRHIFLSKLCYHKHRGYAYSQMQKMDSKEVQKDSKRAELREKYGFDTKFGLHLVRLVLECEQALTEGDIDLRRHSELLRSIRNGEWTKERIKTWFAEKEAHLERLYHENDTLPYKSDEDAIRNLLLNCMEEHYGSLENCVVREDKLVQAIRAIKEVVDKIEV